MKEFKVNKSLVLTGLSLVCTVGSFVVGAISKKDEAAETVNKAAEEAAKIVMDNMSKKEN